MSHVIYWDISVAAETIAEDDVWTKLAQEKGSEDKDATSATEKGTDCLMYDPLFHSAGVVSVVLTYNVSTDYEN